MTDGDQTKESEVLESQVVQAIDRLGESALLYLGSERTETDNTTETNDHGERDETDANNLTARVEASTGLEPGDRVTVQVDARHLLWFDPSSGNNLLKD